MFLSAAGFLLLHLMNLPLLLNAKREKHSLDISCQIRIEKPEFPRVELRLTKAIRVSPDWVIAANTP
jgi:hypothetical protein